LKEVPVGKRKEREKQNRKKLNERSKLAPVKQHTTEGRI